jgi:RNA-directed DNA polymerase
LPKPGRVQKYPFGKPIGPDWNLDANVTKIREEISDRKEDAQGQRLRPLSDCFQMGCGEGYQVGISFDNLDHDWLMRMLEQRVDDRAFLGLIQKWLKAGILDRDGKVLQPESGSPQGGVISPILANVYLHYALDLWFEKIVKPCCEGEAIMCRYADDWVCVFRYKSDAHRFYAVLPKRLAKFGLEVAPDKTKILRFSKYHPGMEQRFTFLGFELYWFKDRKGVPRVMRRTSRKKLQASCRRVHEWIKTNRHVEVKELFQHLNASLVGHYNYYGLRGNYRSLERMFTWVVKCAFKWLNRRGGKRRSYNWDRFNTVLKVVNIARPRITEVRAMRKLFA